MRLYILLILLALGMAFITGYSVYVLEGKNQGGRENRIEVRKLTQRFFLGKKPSFRLDTEVFVKSKDVLDLVLPQKLVDFNESMPVFSSDKSCFQTKTQGEWQKVNKFVRWEELRCNLAKKLSDDFFFKAPYIHPSGYSYTYLAYRSNKKRFEKQSWIQSNIFYFHIRELKHLRDVGIKITPGQKVLMDLSDRNLSGILKEENLVVNETYILKKDNGLMSLFHPRYLVYSFPEFQSTMKKSKYLVSLERSNSNCLIKDRNLCWNYSLKEYLKVVGKANLIFFILGITSVIVILLILILRIRQSKLEDDKRKLALRVLSHEFRTPVTSMILTLENLSKKSSQIDDEITGEILKLSSDAYRLRRLVESSKNYIDLKNKIGVLDKKQLKCIRLKGFIEDLTYSIDDEVNVEVDEQANIYLDEYWLSICLKNLIENAYKHGEAPVVVRSYIKNKKRVIEVEDQGSDTSINLESLTQAFVKGNKSEGSGLGLNIVYQVIENLGGKLLLETNPTRFQMIFSLKEKK